MQARRLWPVNATNGKLLNAAALARTAGSLRPNASQQLAPTLMSVAESVESVAPSAPCSGTRAVQAGQFAGAPPELGASCTHGARSICKLHTRHPQHLQAAMKLVAPPAHLVLIRDVKHVVIITQRRRLGLRRLLGRLAVAVGNLADLLARLFGKV